MKNLLCCILVVIITLSGCRQPSPVPESVSQETVIVQKPTPVTQTEYIYTYEGQGKIGLWSSAPVEVDLRINDRSFGKVALTGEIRELSIGEYTVDGDNVIELIYKDTYRGTINLDHHGPTVTDNYSGTSFTEDELVRLDGFINHEIDEGFPGAVLLIMEKGELVKHTAYGNALVYRGSEALETPQPMTVETLFDLASLTKIFATTFAIMKLEDDGLIKTSDYVHQYLDGFDTEEKSLMTIDHLLTHTSGFDGSHRFFDPDNYYGEDYYSLDRNETMSLLPLLSLKYPTGTDTIYSDLGFITLGAIVESVTGTPLDVYLEGTIYSDLDLSQTLYKPLDKSIQKDNIVATERMGNTRGNRYEWPEIRTYTLQGEVHDELAFYAMNGVSGNAGLFSNAYEVAIMSQTLLNGGVYGEQRIFNEKTVEKFTKQSQMNQRYCLGFDVAGYKDNYRRYSMMASDQAYGKTGWTGTNVLIDPTHDLVVILLTNKRHTPYESGRFLGSDYQTGKYAPIISQIYEMLLDTASYDYEYVEEGHSDESTKTDIILGIDRLDEYAGQYKNQRVGLITNNSGKTSSGESSIDALYEHMDLVALFSPEHGIDGQLEAGQRYGSTRDGVTDLPVYSLYGKDLKPTKKMLEGLDVLAFDIQDVGTRYYTYIYTMLNAMEACGENNVEFVVFDRPNPLGGLQIGGNLVQEAYTSFVGMYPLPIRHGLTVGELAMYANATYELDCDLTVIPMKHWQRSMGYSGTTLTFTAPSPNMRRLETAMVYPGTCLMEGTNISEARGTDYPFEMIGAPFVNPYRLADELESYGLEGVTFIPTSFMPDSAKYEDQLCYGVRIKVDDTVTYKPLAVGISILYALQNLYEDDLELKEWLNYLAGMDLRVLLTEDGLTRQELISLFETPSEFVETSKAFYLYE